MGTFSMTALLFVRLVLHSLASILHFLNLYKMAVNESVQKYYYLLTHQGHAYMRIDDSCIFMNLMTSIIIHLVHIQHHYSNI